MADRYDVTLGKNYFDNITYVGVTQRFLYATEHQVIFRQAFFKALIIVYTLQIKMSEF